MLTVPLKSKPWLYKKWLLAAMAFPALIACSSVKEKPASESSEIGEISEPLYPEKGEGTNPPAVVSMEEYKDPLEIINRPIFKFNDVTYRYLLSPLAHGYQSVVPDPVDKSLGKFFTNLKEPMYSLNNLFQGRPGGFGTSLLRFGINSTLGLLGFFDPAAAWWGIEQRPSTLRDTLAFYGVGYGAYLVLPVLGPSDLRDGASLTFEYFTHPATYMDDRTAALALRSADGFHKRAPLLADYPNMLEGAEDRYEFLRNLYLQREQRDAVELEQQRREK